MIKVQEALTDVLNKRADVYSGTSITNELGESDLIYSKLKTVWCAITFLSGLTTNGKANDVDLTVKCRFTIRKNSITNLTNDMYFMFEGQKYNIDYVLPNFKLRDRLEVYCSLVVK